MISENIPLPEEPYENSMGDTTMMNVINDSTLLPSTVSQDENNEKCEFMMMGNYSKIHEENVTINKYYDEINHSQTDHPTSLYPKVIIQSEKSNTQKRNQRVNDKEKQKSSKGKNSPPKRRELRIRQYDRSRSPPRCNRNYCKSHDNRNKKTDKTRKERHYNDRPQHKYINKPRAKSRENISSYSQSRYNDKNYIKAPKPIEYNEKRYRTSQQNEKIKEYEYRKPRYDERKSRENSSDKKYENYRKHENPNKWKTRENHQNMLYTSNAVNKTNRHYNYQPRLTSTVESACLKNDKYSKVGSSQTKVNTDDGNNKILYDLLEEIKKYINTDELKSQTDQERVPCRYYQQRRCKYGHQCRNLHVHQPSRSPSKPPSTPYSSQQL